MEKVTQVYFNPLAANRAQICSLLKALPIGSAHPFRPDGILLIHSAQDTITDIDISMHPEEYFSNAVNLAELGEGSLERISKFQVLNKFSKEYMIQQAPAPTFKVPLVSGEITIFAVSEMIPTFYDLCIADSNYKTICYAARSQFPGLTHSGDVNTGQLLLHHITATSVTLQEEEYVVFVSGYQNTRLTEYKAKNPLVLIANHTEKVLYVVPVPLDEASIGKAVLCCPMVFKANKADNTLVCSILPAPTTDDDLMCSGPTLPSKSFGAAVARANFTTDLVSLNTRTQTIGSDANVSSFGDRTIAPPLTQNHLILATPKVTLPDLAHLESTQLIRFGTGMFWMDEHDNDPLFDKSASTFPCILGGLLQGPLLLATGDAPEHVQFDNSIQLHQYYKSAKTVTVVVGEDMTDNARNLATTWRINALFIIQSTEGVSSDDSNILPLLENLNINAITALAGPQSLILAQVGNRYFYYRGIANRGEFDFIGMEFGQDVTAILVKADISALMERPWPRLVSLAERNKVFLPKSGREATPAELEEIFESISLSEINALEEDIIFALPQLQILLAQRELETLSSRLLASAQSKIMRHIDGKKRDYVKFLTQEYVDGDNDLKKKKDGLLGDLRRSMKESRACVGWLTRRLGNIMSSQQTSTRTHDLKRLLRQSAIRGNVEAAKSMTFEAMAELLEEHADEMGVLLVNLDTTAYSQLLQNPNSNTNTAGNCLDLDSRILHLVGLDAGIVLQQSQENHSGPLASQRGPDEPILALPYIGQRQGFGSMLAWVCWDEFVNLENPSAVRWVEKCNEPHIATLRILMRQTISNAWCSRELNMSPESGATSHLLSFLLVTSMHKLAKMRTTIPTLSTQPSDTVTKLMRGLFGHLLTVAGSGLQPISMVWQLMGQNPALEVPKAPADWSWYENVATLYPYTGWPVQILSKNLELLLDKIILRLVTHNKLKQGARQYRAEKMTRACKFRNMQLSNLRTVVIGLMEILSASSGYDKMATNLLQILPTPLEDKITCYMRLYYYVQHLSRGGGQHAYFNTTAANVYTRRSAAFRELKTRLIGAVKCDDGAQIQSICSEIIEKRRWVAQKFRVHVDAVKVQGIKNIQNLLAVSLTLEPPMVKTREETYMRVKGDAESCRQRWQIGVGEYGNLDPLDVDALSMALHSTDPSEIKTLFSTSSTYVSKPKSAERDWDQFKTLVNAKFLKTVQNLPAADDVCEMLQVPRSMMHIFISALAPKFQYDRLPHTLSDTIYALLLNPNQNIAKPTRGLLGL